MSDLSLALWIAAATAMFASWLARQRHARRLTGEQKLQILETLQAPRQWMMALVFAAGIAMVVALQKAPQHVLSVGVAAMVALFACVTLMFFRLRRLDLPLGYVLAWGLGATIAPIAFGAWCISVRYAF